MWKTNHERLETCYVEHQKIDSAGFVFSSQHDQNVTGLWFDHNKNASYLPDKISAAFPSVVGLSAEKCALKTIGKSSLSGLVKLKFLWLTGNKIEHIASDTFADLVGLERLYMCEF